MSPVSHVEDDIHFPSASRRLFFALMPPLATREACARAGQTLHLGCGGRTVPVENVHLTLAFLGDVSAGAVPRLRDASTRVSEKSFILILDRAGCWPQSGVGWLGPSQAPDTLIALHDRLVAIARGLGIAVDSRRFSPHVTVLRRARCQASTLETPIHIQWSAQSFALLESKNWNGSVKYGEVASWPLLTE